MKKKMKIRPIKNGIVIDHIEGGQGLNVLKFLRIEAGTDKVISMVINIESDKMGRKDIVKIEDRTLETTEIDKIALISPRATVNRIENFKVIEKHKVVLPDTVEGIVRCQNPGCISNVPEEPATTRFNRCENTLRCFYCEKIIEPGELAKAMLK